ncbi:serine hydrolase [Sphingosinicella sp. CPCC 101087]|uniref:serine hydrolase domain-containing protein n=1 Tax=Sphingosinicella sp. CPCC 101087 TaxID=2497754 RepID=UPI00101C8AA6|nr:serine hydrolase domain-containing protein [Sphingosinicella sp. CPCC 101087]
MPVELRRREFLAAGLVLPILPPASSRAHAGAAGPAPGFETRLRPTVRAADARPSTLADRMAELHVPGVAVAILREGRIGTIGGYGTRTAGAAAPVGPETLFSVGSVSKVATAALCLRLVALGQFDVDRDVGRWLRRWPVPPGPAGDTSPITLRMLLSHTAGFNVHGFRDFAPGAALPDLADILTGTAPATNRPLARIEPAGARARYSGGGYMIVQAILEDAMGAPLDALAARHVFAPLGMRRSRFSASLSPAPADVAHAHGGAGEPAALPRGWQSFPELAASGLWTCAHDLARLIAALTGSFRGEARPFLPRSLATEMMTPVSPGLFGLGPRLAGEGDSAIFHHGGANDSYKAYVEGHLASGDGLAILTNGANGDVLGDEIRNAVSDALGWPGDWSAVVQPIRDRALFAHYPGTYVRRRDQPIEIAGLLDTGFDHERIAIEAAGDGLELRIGDETKALAPLTPSRFVVPGQYVPAGTLQLEFKRSAANRVTSLIASAGGGRLLFDRG